MRPAIPICKGGIRLREVRQLVEVPSQPLLPGFELRLPDFQTTKKSHSCYSSCGLWASSIHTAREPAKMLRISPHLTSVQNVHKTPSWMIQKHKCGRGSGLHHTATADSGLGGRCGLNLQETPGPNLQHSPGAWEPEPGKVSPACQAPFLQLRALRKSLVCSRSKYCRY